MTAGVGLSSTVAAFLAAWFLQPSRREEGNEDKGVQRELALLRASVESLVQKK